VLASQAVTATRATEERCLLVLADGVQAAFAAGAVAELARGGAAWTRGAGGGLGAHVALLALLGEAAECERRWSRQAALGCPMFESRLSAAGRGLGSATGLTLLPDAWSLGGWLDPAGLSEHLAPEDAAVSERLKAARAGMAVAIEDVASGTAEWVELTDLADGETGAVLRAAAAFPAGWGPQRVERRGAAGRAWGGVGPALRGRPPWSGDARGWDVVCGFPVPAVRRPALGEALLELVQRRSEASAADAVTSWLEERGGPELRLVAPTAAGWSACSGRENADLGVEYPLPWERNGEVTGTILRFGALAAAGAVAAVPGPRG